MPTLKERLVLLDFLLPKFGFNNFDELQRKFRDLELDSSTPDNSVFYVNLASKVNFSEVTLKQYDDNLLSYLQKINRGKEKPIRLKYYQYFSLLFTEYYLDRYFTDKHELKDELNLALSTIANEVYKTLPAFTEEDLNKLAFWNATGSGKTFILHLNILQYQHYAHLNDVRGGNLLLLTPNEDLSIQHLDDLKRSGIEANYYLQDKHSDKVKVIDINKIREFSSGKGVSIPLAEFDRNNAIFVDEGHKGDSKEDSAWRKIRNTLSSEGFAFEYSATFGQLNDEALLNEYGKCVVFDYSYGHFYEDGYGKDYWIHNLKGNRILEETEKQRQYLLQNLLLFVQQKLYFINNHDVLKPSEIENPLLIFVGSSVEPKPSSKAVKDENNNVISDVLKVLDFLNDFLTDRDKYIEWIKTLKDNSPQAIFKEDYFSKLSYLFASDNNSDELYDLCLRTVFNHNTVGNLELYTLRNSSGEIGLKIAGADHYFALIYIGDTATFKAPIQGKFTFKNDVTSSSLFESLKDSSKYPVNILIGARKFIVGWNSYRVSSIGLINFGRARGSQIIQLFGRGIRLRGKESSLKRSKNEPDAPANISIVETLNVFGLDADYMEKFSDDLKKEGIKTDKKSLTFDVSITHNLEEAQLLTLVPDHEVPKFESTEVLRLIYLESVKVVVDISTKKFVAIAGQQNVAQQNTTINFRLSEELLGLVNWDRIYTELLLYKKRLASPRMPNLHIPRNLKQLLQQMNYRVVADGEFKISKLEDIEKLQKLVFQIVRKYTELFYKRHLKNYIGNNLTTQVLTGNNSSISQARWEFEIVTTNINGDELEGIEGIISTITNLSDTLTNYPEKLRENNYLLNEWNDAHLYQPLFKDDSAQTLSAGSVKVINSIRPAGLNLGEYTFVEHLRNFISSQKSRYPDYEFYLLRNMSRGNGLGFYFLAGGFYPDFMLWIKEKNSSKQYLTFIDPHGLRNESGWESPKISLHSTIKELEANLGEPNLVLNSFVLQPPPNSLFTTGLNTWHREDDPAREVLLDEYAANKHVFAIPIDGNISGPGGYIDKIISKILA